jgi:hypothetical protein
LREPLAILMMNITPSLSICNPCPTCRRNFCSINMEDNYNLKPLFLTSIPSNYFHWWYFFIIKDGETLLRWGLTDSSFWSKSSCYTFLHLPYMLSIPHLYMFRKTTNTIVWYPFTIICIVLYFIIYLFYFHLIWFISINFIHIE